jgi:hypothetical protein
LPTISSAYALGRSPRSFRLSLTRTASPLTSRFWSEPRPLYSSSFAQLRLRRSSCTPGLLLGAPAHKPVAKEPLRRNHGRERGPSRERRKRARPSRESTHSDPLNHPRVTPAPYPSRYWRPQLRGYYVAKLIPLYSLAFCLRMVVLPGWKRGDSYPPTSAMQSQGIAFQRFPELT